MSKYDIKNVEGKAAGQADLSDDVFGIEPNIPVIHQVVVCQDACLRQGTHSTKNRHEVSGGGRKPWRQKGTGRARQGSIRAAQWTGGGVVFGPTPRDHSKRINKKMVKLAMRSVLSGKVADSELVLVDALSFEKPSTKQAKAVLDAIGVSGKRVTVVIPDDDVISYLSFRNLEKVNCIAVSEANTRNLIDNGALVMTTDIAKQLEEVLA
ncbi:MAG: 50S ribosomal protein L4 [Coriobacteriaceae bacterium]|uniref:50S ribosomal protein L4 n=1 Tax=Tractidigestivibacter sp. TaxID=2847320 RepID=UPI002A826FC9|nr:50S ribosomal protein L4 [Tractidigestivibacter sp.]MCI6275000.1 50S ribosomal protein L4 [Coriobacteriaceae bacterium]MCI6547774.1 50S ribosomal protein L4 [Coriobacteriaceae bacterium]MCI6844575.1 50S ribosomal protein L4 [Coriobacteriaceae bacterium]MDD7584910.1 50S ribosomal protein L4 [Coriobacteriaceae bacterium]MDY4535391.1 50S ribosomal protein L4 [Tractidigestivibacter sp.]